MVVTPWGRTEILCKELETVMILIKAYILHLYLDIVYLCVCLYISIVFFQILINRFIWKKNIVFSDHPAGFMDSTRAAGWNFMNWADNPKPNGIFTIPIGINRHTVDGRNPACNHLGCIKLCK